MEKELTQEETTKQKEQERSEIEAEVFGGKPPEIAGKPEEEQQKIEEEGVEEDPLAGVDPAIKVLLSDINAKLATVETLESRLKQSEQRIGAITNREAERRKKAEEAEKNKPTEEDVRVSLESDEAWTEFEKEFPDMAKAIDGKLNSKTKGSATIDDLRKEISSIKKVDPGDPGVLERRLVGIKHPDWKEIIATPEYKEWLVVQPVDVQKKASHGETAEDAIFVLDNFKAKATNTVSTSEKRQKRLALAANTSNKHKQMKPKAVGDMTEAELRAAAEKEIFG